MFSVILGEPGKSLIAFGEAAKQLVSQVPQSDLRSALDSTMVFTVTSSMAKSQNCEVYEFLLTLG